MIGHDSANSVLSQNNMASALTDNTKTKPVAQDLNAVFARNLSKP